MSLTITSHSGQQALTDHALIEQACSGNQAAFETLVHRYQHRLYGFVRNQLNSEEAHDIVQLVWLQLYLALPTLYEKQAMMQNSTSIKAWLFRVAINRCIDEKRKHERRPAPFSVTELASPDESEYSILASIFDPTPQPETLAEQHDQQARLYAAIQLLQTKFRLVVWLRYTEDLTFHEIGQRLKMPTNTVKTYFYRACEKLRLTLLDV